jgi:hypothetical protein
LKPFGRAKVKIHINSYALLLEAKPRPAALWVFIEDLVAEGETPQELLDSATLTTADGPRKVIDLPIPDANYYFELIMNELNK